MSRTVSQAVEYEDGYQKGHDAGYRTGLAAGQDQDSKRQHWQIIAAIVGVVLVVLSAIGAAAWTAHQNNIKSQVLYEACAGTYIPQDGGDPICLGK